MKYRKWPESYFMRRWSRMTRLSGLSIGTLSGVLKGFCSDPSPSTSLPCLSDTYSSSAGGNNSRFNISPVYKSRKQLRSLRQYVDTLKLFIWNWFLLKTSGSLNKKSRSWSGKIMACLRKQVQICMFYVVGIFRLLHSYLSYNK